MVGSRAESSTSLLLIEDEPSDRILIQEHLREMPDCFSLDYADNLTKGIAKLKTRTYDLVLLDLGLPEAVGINTFEHFHAQFPDVPVIVLTGLDDELVAVTAVNKGAQDYLNKQEADARLLKRTIRHAIERNRLMQELRNASLADALTSLYNRRGFELLAGQQLKAAARTAQVLNLVFVDIDNMKQINDTLGHQTGDSALVALATLMKNACRSSDIVARLGGDEFAMLLYCNGEYGGRKIWERLRQNIESHNQRSDIPYRLEVSAGIVEYESNQPCSLDELLARADRLMYDEKKRKKIISNM
jgi:two-component system, cell cycle response regulator